MTINHYHRSHGAQGLQARYISAPSRKGGVSIPIPRLEGCKPDIIVSSQQLARYHTPPREMSVREMCFPAAAAASGCKVETPVQGRLYTSCCFQSHGEPISFFTTGQLAFESPPHFPQPKLGLKLGLVGFFKSSDASIPT